ncbi:MAG TPA: radical SAM protein [Nitrososphaera sp.]|nr:radical SAM protein [Nitrososphaera sp.]
MQLLDPRSSRKVQQRQPPTSNIPLEWRILLVAPRSGSQTPNFITKIDKQGRHRWLNAYTPAMGIRFIAENFGGIDVLEYPTMQDFEKLLERDHYEVVGISFLTSQTEQAIAMGQIARKHGAKEVWGGGWGIDTPGARTHFDRSFSGYGEQQLLSVIGNRAKGKMRHPVLLGDAHFFKFRAKVGYLYSIRGCKYKCEYCPTPAVIPELLTLELDEIERVLDIYAREKVHAVVIYDETFLQNPKHSWKVIEMLNERGLMWFCLTSSEELDGNVSNLRDKGFLGCLMGMESLRDKTLTDYRRGRLTSTNMRVIKEMKDNSCFVLGTYMFCHELDTKESMRLDIEKLASLEIPAVLPVIFTPFAPTPLFQKYEGRIIDWDWNHWDDGHLVWKHPHVSPEDARQMLFECDSMCNTFSCNVGFAAKEAVRNVLPFVIRKMVGRKSVSRQTVALH